MKEIRFLGTSLDAIKDFTDKAKQDAGYQLHKVQSGDDPDNWKPMNTVGQGVREIRIKDGVQHRIIYTASIGDYVYVLHAFVKKTQQTAKRDIDLARQRLAELNRR